MQNKEKCFFFLAESYSTGTKSIFKLFSIFFTLRTCVLCVMGVTPLVIIIVEFHHLTHSQTTNFRLFQTERACRRQFKFDENEGEVENTEGKREIARYEQLLFFQ